MVRGTVTGVDPPDGFKIVVYARTNRFYLQPCVTEPLSPISPAGSWGPVDSHNGQIWVLLVRDGYAPPAITNALPSVDGRNVFAVTGPVGTLAGCDVGRCPAR